MSVINNNLLLTAPAASATGVSRSLRFSSGDSSYLSRTPASAGNQKTWTWAGWVKRSDIGANRNFILGTGTTGVNSFYSEFSSGYQLNIGEYTSSGWTYQLTTTQVFRDPCAWYHILIAFDTTQSTASDRIKLYANGTLITTFALASYPSLNFNTFVNSTSPHTIGILTGQGYNFSGYLADIYFIDGQALDPTSFTETDATTGQLIPKAFNGVYGSNGWHLDFADNSAATASTLGKDSSGNGNNWSPQNLSVTAGAGNDSLVDVPTSSGTDSGVGGEVRGNYATLNPLNKGAATLTNGNLDWSSGGPNSTCQSSIAMSSGKWYCEFTATSASCIFGLQRAAGTLPTNYLGQAADGWGYNSGNGQKYNNGSAAAYGATYTTGDVIGIAFDADAGTLTFYKNGTSQGQAYSGLANGPYTFAVGSDGSITATANFGQRAFAYPLSGFKALCTTNLPAPLVTKPSTAFDVALWTGNSGTQSITGLGFSPDFVWGKTRSAATYYHALYDTVRGAGPSKSLYSNATDAEGAQSIYTNLTSFDSAGFTLGSTSPNNNILNQSGQTFVGWCWDAGNTTVTNTQGSITASLRANPTAGFSIITGTGNGSFGHGLGVAPAMYIIKDRSSGGTGWWVNHKGLANQSDQYLGLHSTSAVQTTSWGGSPTSTIAYVSNSFVGSDSWVCYAWAPVAGYSSMGSYVGNGSTNGPFVYTGHRSRWIMIKKSSNTGSWIIWDSARDTYNYFQYKLGANLSSAENDPATIGYTYQETLDSCSNGFKLRSTNQFTNSSGETYIYCSFAESPFNYARAR